MVVCVGGRGRRVVSEWEGDGCVRGRNKGYVGDELGGKRGGR